MKTDEEILLKNRRKLEEAGFKLNEIDFIMVHLQEAITLAREDQKKRFVEMIKDLLYQDSAYVIKEEVEELLSKVEEGGE